MDKGIDLAREHAPELAALMPLLKDQLLIVLVKRLGGSVTLPVAEVDDTGQDLLALEFDGDARAFTFTVSKKS
jgi:hypothetical protein